MDALGRTADAVPLSSLTLNSCHPEEPFAMFAAIQRAIRQLVRKSTYVRHSSINKVSIVILILIDLFVLVNVFNGLDSIARWPLAPQEEFPCYTAYADYRRTPQKGTADFDAQTILNLIRPAELSPAPPLAAPFLNSTKPARLGDVSSLCTTPQRLEKEINSAANVQIKAVITKERARIAGFNQEIAELKRQYDSTLLEKIAGQSNQNSINKVPAERVKASIAENNAKIAASQAIVRNQQIQLLQKPAPSAYLKLLKDEAGYKTIKSAYDSAEFWYPNKQLLLQTLFLAPLIALAYWLHISALRRNRDLLALLTWHLLLIFCIPLLVKLLQFLQFGNLVRIVLDAITALLGGLLFIASYALILVIPLLGFGLIKFLQRFVFNPQVQAKNRIQKGHCIRCNFKLSPDAAFCSYCGFHQFIDCPNCHNRAYKYMTYCKHCGHSLESQESTDLA